MPIWQMRARPQKRTPAKAHARESAGPQKRTPAKAPARKSARQRQSARSPKRTLKPCLLFLGGGCKSLS